MTTDEQAAKTWALNTSPWMGECAGDGHTDALSDARNATVRMQTATIEHVAYTGSRSRDWWQQSRRHHMKTASSE